MSASSTEKANVRFPAGFMFDQRAHDAEEMEALAKFWQLEQTQLEPGPYSGRIRALHTARLQIGHSTRSHGTRIDGGIPAGSIVFGIALQTPSETCFRRGPLQVDEVAVLRPGEEIAATSRSASVHLTVAVLEPLVESIATAFGSDSFDALCPGDRLQIAEPGGAQGIARRLTALLDSHIRRGRTIDAEEAAHFQSSVLATLFADLRALPPIPTEPERRRIARRAADYLRAHAHRPLVLFEVCRAIGTAPRTLELGFHETFGLCPKAFVQALRFNGVRRALLGADPARDSVKALALAWGFHHFGRFSVNYRRWFGESPSDTLGRIR